MIERTFWLIPFPAPDIPAISLTGTLWLDRNFLTLHYVLAGNTEDVLLPPVSLAPSRRDELWKRTCFEFFLAIKDQPGYWEFNMSPSGDWNIYRMDDYRKVGFGEEATISQLPFKFKKELVGYSLDVSVDLTSFTKPEHELQMAITAILQTRDRKETYWALTHPAPHADFHVRDSFILLLAAQTHPSAQSALDG
jgi:hypothetical protein